MPIDPIVYQHNTNSTKYIAQATPTSKEFYEFELKPHYVFALEDLYGDEDDDE